MRFRDRRDAGLQLAARLQEQAPHDPVVLALPRGGVPVAAEDRAHDRRAARRARRSQGRRAAAQGSSGSAPWPREA